MTFVHDQFDKPVEFIGLAVSFEIRSRILPIIGDPPSRDFLNEDSPPPP